MVEIANVFFEFLLKISQFCTETMVGSELFHKKCTSKVVSNFLGVHLQINNTAYSTFSG